MHGTTTTQIIEAMLQLSDVTTANATAAKHGLLKKLSGSASEFLNGAGNWATPTDTLPIITVTGSNVNPAASVAGTIYFYILTAAVTVTLPTAVGNSSIYNIKSGSGTSTIATTSSQTIDGVTSASLPVDNALTIVSDGTNWRIF